MSDHHLESPADLDKALATAVSNQLSAAIDARGSATLVVSGGSTPKGLFALLSDVPLNWEQVTVLLADERWVPTDHQDSNERMVRERLLQGRAQGARFVSLVPHYPDQAASLKVVKQQLTEMPTFDVVILGMGGDSHTASLFPCSTEVTEGLTTTEPALVTHPKTAPHARVSLSRRRLSDTRYGCVHIVGADKLDVINNAQQADALEQAPIAAFLPPNDAFEVWYAPK